METQAYLWELLTALEGVRQNPRHHPEGDALYHSLQVFEHARRATPDPELWAAALLHDVGKAVALREHAQIGAELLEGCVPGRVVWLVRHHMDLLYRPRRTRRKLRGRPELVALEQLRRWDVAGRCPNAWVMPLDAAIADLHGVIAWEHEAC